MEDTFHITEDSKIVDIPVKVSHNKILKFRQEGDLFVSLAQLQQHGCFKSWSYHLHCSDFANTIRFQVPDIIRGQHKIKYSGHIEGFGRVQFESGTVSVRQTGYKSYVQTDKPVYKPGQPVR